MCPLRALDLDRVPLMLAPFALAILVTFCGCAGSGSSATTGSAPSSATGFDGALLPTGQRAHGFTLTDQDGRRISLREFRGKVVILAFLYSTSATTAPLIAQQIRGALDELDQPIPAIAISVDPGADTPMHVRAFLKATSLTGRMEYLTGSPVQLRALWRAYRVVPASAGAGAYESHALVLLLDRSGAERVEFPVEQLTPEALAHDIRRLQQD
jgi:protein SCO1/2